MSEDSATYQTSKPYRRNPRQITKNKLAKLDADLWKYGDLGGIVHNLRTGEIIGGNQRTAVFKSASQTEIVQRFDAPDEQGTIAHGFIVWKGKRYAYRQVDWDEATAAAANIRANIGAGDWNWDVLANEWDFSEVKEWMGDDLLKDWKRDTSALDNFLKSEETEPADAEPQIDRAAELNEKWGVVAGDLWQIGPHRLLCGDSTKREDVERVMEGERAVVFSDAPYGVDVVKNNKVGADFGVSKKGIYSPIVGDDTTDTAEEFYKLCVEIGLDNFILWGGNYFTKFLPFGTGWIIWDKRGDSGIKNTFADGEMAWTNMTAQVRIYTQLWNGMIREGEREKRIHPTQKPVDVTQRIMKDFSAPIYYDGFAGSGTTLVACQNLGRICRAIEIDPNYCAVILERMSTAFPELEIKRVDTGN